MLSDSVAAEEVEPAPGAWQMPATGAQLPEPSPAASSAGRHSVSDVQQALHHSQHVNQQLLSSCSAAAMDPDPQQAYQRWHLAQQAAADMLISTHSDGAMRSAQAAQHAQHAQHAEEHMEVIQGLAQHLHAVQQEIAQLRHSSAQFQYQQQLGDPPEMAEAAQRRAQQLEGLEQIKYQVLPRHSSRG